LQRNRVEILDEKTANHVDALGADPAIVGRVHHFHLALDFFVRRPRHNFCHGNLPSNGCFFFNLESRAPSSAPRLTTSAVHGHMILYRKNPGEKNDPDCQERFGRRAQDRRGAERGFYLLHDLRRLQEFPRSVSARGRPGGRSSGKHPPISESGETRRAFSLGHSRPAVYAGKNFHSRHGGRHDPRRRRQRIRIYFYTGRPGRISRSEQNRSAEGARRRRSASPCWRFLFPATTAASPGRRSPSAGPNSSSVRFQATPSSETAWRFTPSGCARKRSKRWSKAICHRRFSCGAIPPAANIFI